jgi:hypothetical protein
MKDQRHKVFRKALDALIESLEALVRVSRWSDGGNEPPEPLRVAVAKLNERLGVADRLRAGTFVGNPAETTHVTALCASMKRLDGAYVAYRKRLDGGAERAEEAAVALEADLALENPSAHDLAPVGAIAGRGAT